MVLYIQHKGEEILKRNDAIATLGPLKKTIQGQRSSKRDTSVSFLHNLIKIKCLLGIEHLILDKSLSF